MMYGATEMNSTELAMSDLLSLGHKEFLPVQIVKLHISDSLLSIQNDFVDVIEDSQKLIICFSIHIQNQLMKTWLFRECKVISDNKLLD